jgi:hypothetical protein
LVTTAILGFPLEDLPHAGTPARSAAAATITAARSHVVMTEPLSEGGVGLP